MDEVRLKHNLDRAFAPPPGYPDPRLLSRTMSAISSDVLHRHRVATPTRQRLLSRAVLWPFVAMLLALALTGAGATFLTLHRSPMSVTPATAAVIFPTKMVSATTGWGVTSRGSSEQVWRTTDGGVRWSEVTPRSPVDSNPYTYTNYFLDESHAWITEVASSGGKNPYLVTFRTTNGGTTWQRGATVSTTFESTTTEFFLDANSGWLVLTGGYPTHAIWPDVYKTSDGGLSWSLVASQAGMGAASDGLLPASASPYFVSTSTGWLTVGLATNNGNATFYFSHTAIFVTHNGGRTWRPQPLPIAPPAGGVLDAPVFFGQRQGVIVMHAITPDTTVKASLLATSDGGLTWTVRPLAWAFIWSIQFVDPAHGWAVAGPSSDFLKSATGAAFPLPIYRTDDGGVTWTPVHTSLQFQNGRERVTDIHFVDTQTGFVTIWNDSGPTMELRSDDGGRSWSVVARCQKALGLSFPPPMCPGHS